MREYINKLQNNPIDLALEFKKLENSIFNAADMSDYNIESNEMLVSWKRMNLKSRLGFNQITLQYERGESWEFPDVYPHDFETNLTLKTLKDNMFKIRIDLNSYKCKLKENLSIIKQEFDALENNWNKIVDDNNINFENEKYSIVICKNPFNIKIIDKNNNLITKTFNERDSYSLMTNEPTPLSFVRRAEDLKKILAFTLQLSPNEKIYGLGESFTRLNKRGQKFDLWTIDAHGCQSKQMYKPIPFFISSNGYGVYIDTTAPITMDIGNTYDEANTMYIGDDSLDIYFFLGTPKEILSSYTELTGRSPMPPLWSFGLWMSRITYDSEEQVRNVAKKLREERIPADVIHLDTGWFEDDWKCDYEFSKNRFNDPKQMIKDLNNEGFKISLWQLPYFTPTNKYFNELLNNNLVIRDCDFGLPTQDAILDFSNPLASEWYKEKIGNLIRDGVSAIKVDFGEAAPIQGIYNSGASGWFEHNLYPLRYNEVVYNATKEASSESDVLIWARSAWAGSQRYPIHWGGDVENTNSGMAASLRAGLSLGLCGFSFWSHDIGGFVKKSEKELYNRWVAFGAMTSHSRCHGLPPKEPWEFGNDFTDKFRDGIEMKYKLMLYIYSEAVKASKAGYPMMRTLFFEYPDDLTTWYIEDQYMLGENLLVAPLFETNKDEREVYLPKGKWIDYQSKKEYIGEKWHKIKSGQIPILIFIKEGTIIPEVEVAQSTDRINWNNIKIDINYNSNHEAILDIFMPSGIKIYEKINKLSLVDDLKNINKKYSIKITKK